MRNSIICILFLTLVYSIRGQTPESISYQAIVRNADQSLAINLDVGVHVLIRQGRGGGPSKL